MDLAFLVITTYFVLCCHTSSAIPRDDQTGHSLGTISSQKENDIQYATVKEIDTKDVRPFRKRLANVVQYQVTLDNETFTVTLRPNKHLVTPGCLIHRYLPGDKKEMYPCSRERLDCYYTGSSDVHNESWVAANICNGLNGVISFDNTSLFIEPINIYKSRGAPHGSVHAVYRFQGNKQICPVEDAFSGNRLHVVYERQKRALKTRHLRTRLIVDPTMFHYHRNYDNTNAYTLVAFNIASKLFSDPSLGTKIQLTLSDLHIFETYENFSSELTENANNTLRKFCDWQSKLKSEADCSLLLTRLDLETDNHNKGINGLSHPKGMCDNNLRCAIVEDEGPITGITIAHEIGHLLGMTHDDGSNGVGIMSAGGWSGREAFTWSKQSAVEIESSLLSKEMSCLYESSENLLDENRLEFPLPGTLYTADQQCKMRNNDSYVYFRDSTVMPDDPCKNILCRYKNNPILLISSPLLDGSDCNNTRTDDNTYSTPPGAGVEYVGYTFILDHVKWCIRGQCVAIDHVHASLSPVNGGWSAWDEQYTACSRSCGGGVKTKRRYCNNPRPQYGGKVCPGSSSQERICNLQACMSDYRTIQCEQRAMLQNVRGQWTPELGSLGDESCILQCSNNMSQFLLGSSYKDGTECIRNETVPFSRCVGGKCVEFGCDGHSHSGLKYDKCGVCNGTGSTCMQMSGIYNKDNSSKVYTNVTMIPSGSSGIQIQQKNKYCFLSLLVDGKRVLNANKKRDMSALFNLYGVQFRYTYRPETIEIPGTISKPVVLQIYREYDYRHHVNVTPEITYTFYTPDPHTQQSYAWAEIPSQTCSRSCGTGVKSKIVQCMSVKGQFVEDFHCDLITKPEMQYTQCNTQPCPPSWITSEWGRCSLPCGEGTKFRTLTCVRMVNGTDEVLPSMKCELLPKPSNASRCNNVCEWKSGKWSKCTRTCGEGYSFRNLSCFQHYGVELDNKFCDKSNRPRDTKRCKQGPCYVLDGTCVDKHPNCGKYYDYEATACDGTYKSWMMTNCLKTCGICANGSCVNERVCQQLDPTVDACHAHSDWMRAHCPQKCNICQDCEDCSKYDHVKYCTDSKYGSYMRQHCPKTCKFC